MPRPSQHSSAWSHASAVHSLDQLHGLPESCRTAAPAQQKGVSYRCNMHKTFIYLISSKQAHSRAVPAQRFCTDKPLVLAVLEA